MPAIVYVCFDTAGGGEELAVSIGFGVAIGDRSRP